MKPATIRASERLLAPQQPRAMVPRGTVGAEPAMGRAESSATGPGLATGRAPGVALVLGVLDLDPAARGWAPEVPAEPGRMPSARWGCQAPGQ